jgi:hypothetical protein
MLEKIINSMLHGNFKTKVFLWSVCLLGIGAIILLLAGIVLSMPALIMGGVVVGLLGLIVSQSVSLNDLTREKKSKTKKSRDKAGKESGVHGSSSDGSNAEEEEEDGSGSKSRKQKEKEKSQFLSSFDDKKVKKLLKNHKVNQIHVKVMIDSYPAKKIEQAPAFMWRTDTMLHFLIMTGKAEEFEVPLSDIQGILLVKNVPADPDSDYAFFQYSSFMSKMFQPYLPEYFEGTKEGHLNVTKNTFRIEPGIYLTNSSVANLRSVLLPGVAFLVDDSVMAADRFNEYFKELYRSSLLCKNLVITLDEYREQIQKTLDALLDAPISGTEFVNTIYDLNKYRLITKNDVVLYTQKYRELKMGQN